MWVTLDRCAHFEITPSFCWADVWSVRIGRHFSEGLFTSGFWRRDMFELSHVLGTRKLALAAIVAVIGTASQAAPIISSGQNLEVQKRSSGFPPSPEYSVSQAQPATGFRAGYQSSFY